jgi:acetyltransferase-like isoleucine patch superfamily enzyme
MRHGCYILLEKLLRWSVNPRLRSRLLVFFGATVGANTRIYEIHLFNLKDGFKNLRIADNVHIGPGCRLDLEGGLTIGSRSTLSPGVTILTHADPGRHHGSRLAALYPPLTKEVAIGSDCWLGANVTVLAGVKIGNLAVVAAGSVVTADVPPEVLVAGAPARPKKKLTTGLPT